MRKMSGLLSELSGGYDEEDPQLLNPDEKHQDFGVSLTQLRHLTEVKDSKGLFKVFFKVVPRSQVVTAVILSAGKEQRGTCSAGRRSRPCGSSQIRPQFRPGH